LLRLVQRIPRIQDLTGSDQNLSHLTLRLIIWRDGEQPTRMNKNNRI
jgi:hypothetical protein